MTDERCRVCDRPHASEAEWSSTSPGERDDPCCGGCDPIAVDWRSRAIKAEAELSEARSALRCRGIDTGII